VQALHLGVLAAGLLVTLQLTALSFAGALALGTVLAVFRISPVPPLRALGFGYVELFRNMPLLVLLVLFVFGLPDIGIQYSLFASVVICLVLNAAASVCEAVRSGVRTVGVGQVEAARSLGLRFGQILRHVVLAQAFRAMVQPLVNVFIGIVLSTSLAAAVGVSELTGRSQFLTLQYSEPVVTFLLAGACYLAITLLGGLVGGRIERRLAIHR
jgi:glutamate transport system permease protein